MKFTKWLNEINQEFIDDLEELPDFNNLFPNFLVRTRIPFPTDPAALSILNKIKKLGFTPNFNKGTVANDRRVIRMGKFILNNKAFDPDEKKWWNSQGQAIEALDFADQTKDFIIVVSRNPIDIARMSDHDGITSCHSQNRSYFKCALAEAKEGGPIAYVVKRNDLQNIDLQAKEIFEDKKRKVKGIVPLARLRLRKFINKKENYNLAVPEIRVYGKQIPGFLQIVSDWALQNQQDVLKGKRPKMEDFVRTGGSYTDSQASDLFNNFFNDDEDSGDVDYEGEQEGLSLFDQYEQEVDQIENEFKGKFNFASYWVDVEDDERPYVGFSGGISIEIDGELIKPLSREGESYWKTTSKLREIVRDAAAHVGVYAEDVEIEEHPDGLTFNMNINSDEEPNPDGFRNFLTYLLDDVEPKKEQLMQSVKTALINSGYLAPHYVSKLVNTPPPNLRNFRWIYPKKHEQSHAIQAVSTPKLLGNLGNKKPSTRYDYGQMATVIDENTPALQKFKTILLQKISQLIQKRNAQDTKQKTFWNLSRQTIPDLKIMPEVKFTYQYALNNTKNIFFSIELTFHVLHNEQDVMDAQATLAFLDQYYETLAQQMQIIFESQIKPEIPESVPESFQEFIKCC